MNFILPTSKRVRINTKKDINDIMYRDIIKNIKEYRDKSKEEINARLQHLDKEWDTERVLETSASSFVILGTVLAMTLNVSWSFLSFLIGLFLLQHAIQGWCPPLPVIRKLGIRTPSEITVEKTILELLKDKPQEISIESIKHIVINTI